MTREEFSEYLKKLPCIETQLVYLRQRYDHEEDWEYLNEILSVDMDAPGYYIWENDWNEGQENVEILGCVPISEIDIPTFANDKKVKIAIKVSEELLKKNITGLDASDIWDIREAIKNGTIIGIDKEGEDAD